MRNIHRKFCAIQLIVSVAVILFIPTSLYAGMEENSQKEIEKYIDTFQRPFRMTQHTTAESLAYAGRSDPQIFDLIEKQLLDNYKSLDDPYDVDWASWLAKALGFSGNNKYSETLALLQRDAPDRKLRKYAKIGANLTHKYNRWNAIMVDTENYDDQLSLAQNRYANMLRSEVPELQVLAAKRIFFEGIRIDKMTKLVQYRIDHPSPKADRGTSKWLKKSLCTDCKTFGSRP
jgi:hypothetical protein